MSQTPALLEDQMALESEMEVYRSKLPEWREHEGKFVLIHGSRVVDFFSTYDDAIKAGYQQFDLTPFLVKRISTIEVVQFISRLADPRGRPV